MKWAVGVITAPRKQGCYLERTLNSICKAGWQGLVLFAEPGSPIPASYQGDVVSRPKLFGDWTNWATGLYELLLSEPDAAYFAMFEDDVVVCRGAKSYLEYAIPCLEDFASLSIYTPPVCHRKCQGFYNNCRGWDTIGTQTVIMTHESVIRFFSDYQVQSHRFSKVGDPGTPYCFIDAFPVGNTVKDAVIGRWAEKSKLPVFYHTPSLAQHIGAESTLFDTPGHRAEDFVGEENDLRDWLNQPVQCRRFTKMPVL